MSPENTDHEISSLSDLPAEKDKYRDVLSPGEERPTSAQTDTETSRSTDYGSLSDGELPNTYRRTTRRLSYGERAPVSPRMEKSSSAQMEATLRAIGEELARCRHLLISSHPQGTIETNEDRIDITVLWLSLDEDCEAMQNPDIKRIYVAYSFLEHSGADLETPISLPKPKHNGDKCYFNFRRTFAISDQDVAVLSRMSRRRTSNFPNARNCIVFCIVSEPPQDPHSKTCCEDIGRAYLFLGDVLENSEGNECTELVAVRGVARGVLAVQVNNLQVLRRYRHLSSPRGRVE